MVDENYSLVAAHVDQSIRDKILNGEYVDFAKLLPRDRIGWHDDNRMEMMYKDGRTYFVPASERDNISISSFNRWEQAFRIFCNIYTEKFPGKAVELTQYGHIIFSASMSYMWDNVYAYDKDFRIHLSKFGNRRSWGIILQQAWSLRLKDRIGDRGGNRSSAMGWSPNTPQNRTKKDVCWRFNRGNCNYGASCKFDHKCALCHKFGHGSHNCRRADRQQPQQQYQYPQQPPQPQYRPNNDRWWDRDYRYVVREDSNNNSSSNNNNNNGQSKRFAGKKK